MKINGKKIAQLREEKNISQKKFAAEIHTSQQMVSFIESGARQSSVELLQRIATYFDCSLDDLVIKPKKNMQP